MTSNRSLLFCWFAATGAALCGQSAPNDEPSGAIALSTGINPAAPGGADAAVFDNVGATDTAGYAACDAFQPRRDVYFTYVAEHTGHTVFSLCKPAGLAGGTLRKASILVYNAAGTILLGCDEGACSEWDENLSACHFSTVINVTYLIRVGSKSGNNSGPSLPPATGSFRVTISKVQAVADACASAVPLPAAEGAIAGSTIGITPGGGLPASACGAGLSDVWYAFTPPSDGWFAIDAEVPRLSVGSAPLNPLAVLSQLRLFDAAAGCGALVEVACDSFSPYLSAPVVGGTPYLVALGRDPAVFGGRFLSTWRFVPAPPPNDACSAAIPVVPGVQYGTTFGATAGADLASSPPAEDVWYAYAAPVGGLVYAWGVGAAVTACVGACGSLSLVGLGNGTPAHPVRFEAAAGTTYYFRCYRNLASGGFEAFDDAFRFTLMAEAPPAPNPTAATAIELFDGVNPVPPDGAPGAFFTNLNGAVEISMAPFPIPSPEPVVWFRHVATAEGLLVETCPAPGFDAGGAFGPVVAVFEDLGGAPGAFVANGAPECDGGCRVSFLTDPGQAFLFRLTTNTPDSAIALGAGTFRLRVRHAARGFILPGCGMSATATSLTGPPPILGTSFNLNVSHVAINTPTVTLFASTCPAAPIPVWVGGMTCDAYVDVFSTAFVVLATQATTPCNCSSWSATIPLTLPADPALDAVRLCLQAGWANPAGFVFLSSGLEAVLGA
jgi:hypothetical protein